MLQQLRLPPGIRHAQRVAFGVTEHEQTARSKKLRQMRVIEESLGKRGRTPPDIFFSVRRIRQDQIEPFLGRRQLAHRDEDNLHPHMQISGRKTCDLKIPPQYLRVTRRLLDTQGGRRATTETFQTQRPSSGEKLQYSRPDHAAAQTVEYGLLDEVRRGPNIQSLGHFQDAARRLSTGDAHG